MPTPKHTVTIGVQSEGTDLNAGEYVKVTNLTSGGTLRGSADDTGEVVLSPPPDFAYTWKNGDICSIQIGGRMLISQNETISKGGIHIKLNAAADTASPAVDL